MNTANHLQNLLSIRRIVNKIVNESKQRAELLAKNSKSPPLKLLQQPADKLKLWERPRKRPCTENVTEQGGFMEVEALGESIFRTESTPNQLVQRPKTDPSGTSGKNPSVEGLIRPVCGFAKLVTNTNSKIREPKTYNEIIHNSVHRNR